MPSHDSSKRIQNMLLGLAWLGELDREQIQRLWFPHQSESTVTKLLTELRRDALITPRHWSIRDTATNTTKPQLARWSLAPAGQAQVKSSDQYPNNPARPRQQRLITHDLRTVATIVRLIELARPAGLSGVFVAYEVRLDPTKRRPIADALLSMQLGDYAEPHLVPWSKDPPLAEEYCVRFAIEADNDTEPRAVIAGKADIYRQMRADPAWANWWRQRYGPFPEIFWVVPDHARLQAIYDLWKAAWPRGEWLIATDHQLEQNTFLSWNHGLRHWQSFDFAKVRPTPALAQTLPLQTALPAPSDTSTQPGSIPPAEILARPVVAETTSGEGCTIEQAPQAPGMQIGEQHADNRNRDDQAIEQILADIARQYEHRRAPTRLAHAVHQLQHGLAASVGLLVVLVGVAGAALTWLWRLLARRQLLRPLAAVLSITLIMLVFWQLLGTATLALVAEVRQQIVLPRWPVVPTAPLPESTVSIPSPTPYGCARVRVIARRVHLRLDPGLNGQVIRILSEGDVLDVLNCTPMTKDGHQWLRVLGAQEVVPGWVAAELVAVN